jgi:uncharacterized protein YggE
MRTLLLAAACAAGLGAGAALAETPVRSVTVLGRGAAEAPPDMARAAFGVSARAPEAAEAWAEVARRAAAIIDAARAQGIADADIQTVSLTLRPVYAAARDEAPKLEGYEARHALSVAVRDLAKLGPTLDAAAAAGANAFEGVAFDVADRAPLEDQARRAAVADARRTAGLLAEGAGARLGSAREITLLGGGGPSPMMMRAAMDEAMPVAAGTLTVSAEVSASFALED